MQEDNTDGEPDWDAQLHVTLTPKLLIYTLFATAHSVHTGWSSCIDETLSLTNLAVIDETTGNYCRFIEQEYMEDGNDAIILHDWTVELRLGQVLITGHWQVDSDSTSPIDWKWCAKEAKRAFEKGCVLFGRRVRKSMEVEAPDLDLQPPKQVRH